jgi:outer membrane protein assembly factor BamB
MHVRLASFALVLASAAAVAARAEDWPQFRGPTGAGLTDEQGLPTEWGADKNVAWKVPLPGVAWSQPIVVGDTIFVTTAVTENQPKPQAGGGGFGGGFGGRGRGRGGPPPQDAPPPDADRAPDASDDAPPAEDTQRPRGRRPRGGPGGFGGGFGGRADPPDVTYRWIVLCLDRSTGDVRWQQVAREAKPTIPIHQTNTYASETPVTDGKHVYAYFGMTGVYCYDLEGNLVWSKELGSFPMQFGWGTGSSPVLVGENLIVQCDNEQDSFLVALNKHTGDEVWRKPREEKSNWSTPYLWTNKLRTELIALGANRVRSYDPLTGHVLWEMGGLNSACSATPVGDEELLYVGTAGGFQPGPLLAVRAGAEGDITPASADELGPSVAWIAERGGPRMASPLLYQGCLYVLEQRGGIVACYDAAGGKLLYRERLPEARGFTSSPWAYEGKVFCLDEGGQTFVLAAGPEFQLLGTNKLDEMFWSSAAVAGGNVLLRGVDHLYCIGR